MTNANNSWAILPDGHYVVEVTGIERKTDSKNRKVVEWSLRVVEGNLAGTEFTKKYYLANEKVIKFLTKELAGIGIVATTGEELDREKDKVIGRRIFMDVVTSKANGSQGYYVKGLVNTAPVVTTVQSELLSKW
jgi:hypothetical protein